MIGVKSFKEHEPDNIISIEKEKILKTAVVYGNNASGKSNLVKGLQSMKEMVKSSFRDALIEKDSTFQTEKFLLNTETEKAPSLFEVIFIYENTKYKYGFEVGNNTILKEWLYYTSTKETPLFIRERNNYKINKTSFKEGINLDKKTRENVLFLSLVAQFNGTISNKIIEWFNNVNFISGIHDKGYGIYTINKLKNDKNFNKWLSLILNHLEISNITIEEVDFKEEELNEIIDKTDDEKLKNFITALNKLGNQTKKIRISTWHKKYNNNNLLVDTIPFDLEKQESEGTKKFINLLGPWYDTLKKGKILIVDELDSRLHTQLTKNLIELFHVHNNNSAQLIFTSHDVNLLDKDIFRRDQIWFIEKDQFGSSQLYSLADFKAERVRKTSSFSKNYLNGKYGATSYFKLKDSITKLLTDE
jgi:AAA15 family ATPase/GTPase